MKGMQKIKRGRSFMKLKSYCVSHDNGHRIGGNATIREMIAAANQRKDIQKPVWHSSLRLPEGETISDEKWNLIATEYLHELGFSESHPFEIIKHESKEGEHVHIIASRVGMDGKIYLGQNENLRSTKIVAALEKKTG